MNKSCCTNIDWGKPSYLVTKAWEGAGIGSATAPAARHEVAR